MVFALEPLLAALWMKEVLAEGNTENGFTGLEGFHADGTFAERKLIMIYNFLIVGQMLEIIKDFLAGSSLCLFLRSTIVSFSVIHSL